jgi:hypothetical protein
MSPNTIPDSVISLVGDIAAKPYLKNYEGLKMSLGATCPITKRAAEVFIKEHKAQLEALGKALHELGIGEEIC